MASRFGSNLIVLIAAAFLASLRFTFHGAALIWLAFGVGCLVVTVVGCAFLVRGRGPLQRMFDIAALAIGSWTIVSSLTLQPSTVGWLALGEGAGLGVLAVGGLIAHEARLEFAIGHERRVAQAAAAAADSDDRRWRPAPVAVERRTG